VDLLFLTARLVVGPAAGLLSGDETSDGEQAPVGVVARPLADRIAVLVGAAEARLAGAVGARPRPGLLAAVELALEHHLSVVEVEAPIAFLLAGDELALLFDRAVRVPEDPVAEADLLDCVIGAGATDLAAEDALLGVGQPLAAERRAGARRRAVLDVLDVGD